LLLMDSRYCFCINIAINLFSDDMKISPDGNLMSTSKYLVKEAASSEDENGNSPSSKSASPKPSKSSSSNRKKSDSGVNIESIQQPEKMETIASART
uniref:Transcription factor n=1 Tax=Anisakis simplex TaxID=6269 RepID=A0A0M3J915_ANISI